VSLGNPLEEPTCERQEFDGPLVDVEFLEAKHAALVDLGAVVALFPSTGRITITVAFPFTCTATITVAITSTITVTSTSSRFVTRATRSRLRRRPRSSAAS
jgi:hypothetical protein